MKTSGIRLAHSALLLCVMLACKASIANAEGTDPSIIAAFKARPLEEQIEHLTQSAEKGFVLDGLDTPTEFALLASEKAIQNRMDWLDEPLPPEWLDAFEVLLAKPDYPEARLRAAVLLLRHGRESGRVYLMNLVTASHDLAAAKVFAVAREPGTEQVIVDALLAAPARSDTTREIGYLLRDWESPAMDALLAPGPARENFMRRTGTRILRLANPAGEGEALARAESQWSQTMHNPEIDQEGRVYAASQIVRVHPDNEEARTFLLTELARRPFGRYAYRHVIDAFYYSRDPQFVPVLVNAIPDLLTPDANETRDGKCNRLGALKYAVEIVVRLGGTIPEATVAQVLDALLDDCAGDDMKRVFMALLRTNSATAVQRMNQLYGVEETAQIIAIQQLKPVSDAYPQYVPRSSRGWVWHFSPQW